MSPARSAGVRRNLVQLRSRSTSWPVRHLASAARIADIRAIDTAIPCRFGDQRPIRPSRECRCPHAPAVPQVHRLGKDRAAMFGAADHCVHHQMATAGISSAPVTDHHRVARLPGAILGIRAALAHLLQSTDQMPSPAAQASVTSTITLCRRPYPLAPLSDKASRRDTHGLSGLQ